MQLFVGKVLIPVSYIIGVPWNESEDVGKLIGIKTMVNEFVAFQEMQNMTLTVSNYLLASIKGFRSYEHHTLFIFDNLERAVVTITCFRCSPEPE